MCALGMTHRESFARGQMSSVAFTSLGCCHLFIFHLRSFQTSLSIQVSFSVFVHLPNRWRWISKFIKWIALQQGYFPNCEKKMHHFYWVSKFEYRIMWACTFAHWCMCTTHHCFCVCWALFKGHAFVQAQMMQLAETWLLLEACPCWHTYRKPWLLGHTLYRLPTRLLSGPSITAVMQRQLKHVGPRHFIISSIRCFYWRCRVFVQEDAAFFSSAVSERSNIILSEDNMALIVKTPKNFL